MISPEGFFLFRRISITEVASATAWAPMGEAASPNLFRLVRL